MKAGSKEPGKKVYQQLDLKIRRLATGTAGITPLRFNLPTADFFNLQKYLNSVSSIPRILNKKFMSGVEQMSWMHTIQASGEVGAQYRKVIIKNKKGSKV